MLHFSWQPSASFSLLQPPSVIGAKQLSVVNHAVRRVV